MAKKSQPKELVPVTGELQKSLDIINSLKTQVDEVGVQLLQIQVVDESTLAVCQQNLSKANGIVKTIEEKRVELKAPYLEAGKTIDNLCKSITETISGGMKHAKDQVAAWERKRLEEAVKAQEEINRKAREEQEKIAAEEARKKKITDYISNELTPYLQNTYDGLKTAKDCDTFLETIRTRFPGVDKFQEYLGEANQIRDNYVSLIQSKKAQLSAADNMSEAEKEILIERERLFVMKQELAAKELEIKKREEEAEAEKKRKEAEEAAEQERLKIQAQADLEKTRNTRYLWKFEVVDINDVPKEWLCVDTDKVKEYLKENKDKLVDGHLVYGIKFYKELSITA